MTRSFRITAACVAGAAFALSPAHAQNMAQNTAQLARGAYIFNLSGCGGCHTDKKNGGAGLAGGRAFATDFGTFFSPNITPDKATGIGTWTFENFRTALRDGVSPDGKNYFPAFPYTSYTHMTDQDIADLWAYLLAQPSVARTNSDHDVKSPYGWRWLMTFWNWLYLDRGAKPEWGRGRYIAEALSHCHECHTPRNFLGGYDAAKSYAGTLRNPEGIAVPNITQDLETGVGKWPPGDFELLFTIGMLPDTDFVGGVMAESVTNATSKMTPPDRKDLIEYLRSLEPIHNPVKRKKSHDSGGFD